MESTFQETTALHDEHVQYKTSSLMSQTVPLRLFFIRWPSMDKQSWRNFLRICIRQKQSTSGPLRWLLKSLSRVRNFGASYDRKRHFQTIFLAPGLDQLSLAFRSQKNKETILTLDPSRTRWHPVCYLPRVPRSVSKIRTGIHQQNVDCDGIL